MPLPEFLKALVKSKLTAYCEAKVPLTVRHQVKLAFKFKGNTVELYEQRVAYNDTSIWIDCPVAKFRFSPTSQDWTLYYRDRNQHWHLFDEVEPDKSFEKILKEVDKDRTGIFWG